MQLRERVKYKTGSGVSIPRDFAAQFPKSRNFLDREIR